MTDAPFFHSNKYSADNACEHCDKVVGHEPWCITTNRNVFYAYQIVLAPDKLDEGDTIILRGLGVVWSAPCDGKCSK